MSDDDRSPKLISMTLVGEDEHGQLHELVFEVGGKRMKSVGRIKDWRYERAEKSLTVLPASDDDAFASISKGFVGFDVPASGFEFPDAEFKRGYVNESGVSRSETDEEFAERIKRELDKR